MQKDAHVRCVTQNGLANLDRHTNKVSISRDENAGDHLMKLKREEVAAGLQKYRFS